jgi:hypothetical protein
MWLCLPEGLLSVVTDENSPDRLLVRARNPAHLRSALPDHEILMRAGTDYVARTWVPRGELAAVVAERVQKVDYPNFKASVRDPALHDLYVEFWALHWRYQQEVSGSGA